MKPLVYDICGGDLVVQAGGEKAVCSCCGIQYSLERIREKVLEIRGTVRVEGTVQTNQTGSREDVDQWRKLLEKYYAAGDFQSANQIVKKILEAIPNDPQANQMYDELQVLKDLEVNNGTLVKYHGAASNITIPSCVKIIGPDAFKDCKSLEHIILANTVEQIQGCAFFGCTNLQTIILPESVESIGYGAFYYCSSLAKILIPDTVKNVGSDIFHGCKNLKEVTIPDRFVTQDVFEENHYGEDGDYYSSYCSCLWYQNRLKEQKEQAKRERIENWKRNYRCQHCGGKFTSWTMRCKQCGRPKDY